MGHVCEWKDSSTFGILPYNPMTYPLHRNWGWRTISSNA